METNLPAVLPEHIGIIMDGNGRWAKKKGLPRTAGHTEGAKNFRRIARYCSDIGIRYLTVYAFSTENWARPAVEVNALIRLFQEYLEEAIRDFADDDIQVRFIGDTSAFPKKLQELIATTWEVCKHRTGMVLNIAMNYGGRPEILMAARKLAQKVQAGELRPEDIGEDSFSNEL